MGSSSRLVKQAALALLGAVFCCGATLAFAADSPSSTPTEPLADGLYLKVSPDHPLKISSLKAGDVVEGSLSRDVYSADRKLFPAGSHVRLVVDHTEKRHRAKNDHWPWVIKVFTPRHENYPVFKTATIAHLEQERALDVSLIAVNRTREVQARAKRLKGSADEHGAVEVANSNSHQKTVPTIVLEAKEASAAISEDVTDAEPGPTGPQTIPAGTQCKILLLGDVSASKSKPGDTVRARLLEPVLLNSRVVMLPAGSIFSGKVLRKTPPRWLSRAGSLYLTFTEVTLPQGQSVPVAASLAGAELDSASHTRIDSEGRLHGQRPGAAWMAINLGVSAGISKEVDDGVQLVIEALVSTATDASTAGTSRIIAGAVSGVYMVTRHGRDVVLPRFTEMEISLDRPLSVGPQMQTASVVQDH